MVDSINNPFRQMKGYCQIDGGETFYGGGSVAENSKLSDVEKLKNKSVWTLEDRKQAERCLNEIDFSTRASDNDTEEAKAAFELWGRMKTETTKLTGSKALDAVNEALESEEPVPEIKSTEPEDEVDDEEGSVIYDVAEYSDKNARPFAPVQYVTEEVPVSEDEEPEVDDEEIVKEEIRPEGHFLETKGGTKIYRFNNGIEQELYKDGSGVRFYTDGVVEKRNLLDNGAIKYVRSFQGKDYGTKIEFHDSFGKTTKLMAYFGNKEIVYNFKLQKGFVKNGNSQLKPIDANEMRKLISLENDKAIRKISDNQEYC